MPTLLHTQMCCNQKDNNMNIKKEWEGIQITISKKYIKEFFTDFICQHRADEIHSDLLNVLPKDMSDNTCKLLDGR